MVSVAPYFVVLTPDPGYKNSPIIKVLTRASEICKLQSGYSYMPPTTIPDVAGPNISPHYVGAPLPPKSHLSSMAHIAGDYYIGIDVGTGSARACIVNQAGDIIGLASKDIETSQPEQGFYEQSTVGIWNSICLAVRTAITHNNIDPSRIAGIGFDATCSLAIFERETGEPISVTGTGFCSERNVILWLDHRAGREAEAINATAHRVLDYVGGKMSVEMEIPKIMWLKNHMPRHLFEKCKFYDLADALTYIATGLESRSFCSVVCKQGYLPAAIDKGQNGWQADFMNAIGLGELTDDGYSRLGGINKLVC